jgi:hypothetical protein
LNCSGTAPTELLATVTGLAAGVYPSDVCDQVFCYDNFGSPCTGLFAGTAAAIVARINANPFALALQAPGTGGIPNPGNCGWIFTQYCRCWMGIYATVYAAGTSVLYLDPYTGLSYGAAFTVPAGKWSLVLHLSFGIDVCGLFPGGWPSTGGTAAVYRADFSSAPKCNVSDVSLAFQGQVHYENSPGYYSFDGSASSAVLTHP